MKKNDRLVLNLFDHKRDFGRETFAIFHIKSKITIFYYKKQKG